MTLREELRVAVAEVDQARETLAEVRSEIAALEAEHHALYAARTEALARVAHAEGEAKRLRLVLFALQRQDGEWNPGVQTYGLTVEQHRVLRYEDTAAIRWLLAQVRVNFSPAVHFLTLALDKNRTAFEAMLRALPPEQWPEGMQEKAEPRVKMAAGPRLGHAVAQTDEAEERGAQDAEDAIADLAHRLTQE